MRKTFIIFIIFFLICAVSILILKNLNYQWAIPEYIFYITFILVKTRVFFQIYKNLQKFHDFEFKRISKSMIIQYLVGISTISVILGWKIKWAFDVHFSESKWQHTCEIIAQVIETDITFITFLGQFTVWFNDVVFLPVFIMAWNILKIKPSEDVLQGISKLDDLLKVSVF